MTHIRTAFGRAGAGWPQWLAKAGAGVLLGAALYAMAWCAATPFGTLAVLMLAASAATACLALCTGE